MPAPPITRYLTGQEVNWRAKADKYWEATLHEDAAKGERTVLMKMEPGASFPMHGHEGEWEQIYVLSGSFSDQNRTLKAGDFACREPGAPHSSHSDEGCIALLIYSRG